MNLHPSEEHIVTRPELTPMNKAQHAADAAAAALTWRASAAVAPKVLTTPPIVEAAKYDQSLTVLRWLGSLLFIGGFITMVTGFTRTLPRNGFTDSTAVQILQFAGVSTMIVVAGGIVLLLGGMSLVGSLIVTAVKASK